ncbi:chromosomal replication initiator protein DnaA [Bacteroidia bacterium]|nr:chromosomal replication initiator protein DnaA [Bacteroidia bacterium]GHV30074.1 chromosomal replication initiator protein DnaA [Bacteroidia bacterium]
MEIIKDNVSDKAFHTWFVPIIPIKYQDNDFTVQVPSHFFYEYLEEHYADLIYASLSRVAGKHLVLYYRIIVDQSNEKGGGTILQSERPSPVGEVKKTATQLNKSPNGLVPVAEWNPNLNPRLTFRNFFEGDSNLLARRVGESICENPGKTFNPLFIHGCPGVGKTHLCHAIGNRMAERFPEKKVMYISSHLFQVQFTDASRNNVSNDFINFYQGVDILIVDDIQELAGKEKTQNAYFHIFNHLHLLGKQIILTADKAPTDLQGIEERLISRFKWGATTELFKPDLELRKKILRNKIKQDGLKISEDIVDYIAENVTEHIRDLEGIITSLVAHSLVCNREVDLELAKRVVNKAVKIEKKQITVEKIQGVVSNYFKIDLNEIHSKSRKREIVQARQVTMFLSKKYTDYSYSRIGSLVGKRDHATVLHACRAIQDSLDIDKAFRITMNDIETLLKR